MQQREYYIGIDMGTQGIRCGIIDDSGEIIVAEESYYDIYFPNPGQAIQKPADWMKSFYEVLGKCTSEVSKEVLKNVKGMSICATASTVVAVDENGRSISDAILWMDNRARNQAERINNTKHDVLKHCGEEVSVEWIVPKVLWVKENEREVFDKAYKFVEQLDYLNFQLTGNWCASICQSTCKGNYVGEEGGWSADFFEKIGIPEYNEKLNTDVKLLGEIVGHLNKKYTDRFNLPENLRVYQGGIDAHIAMLGMGVSRPGDMGVIMGTSFVHLILSENPVYNNGIWGPYKDAVVPGLYCLEGGQVSAGSITKWFLREFNIKNEDPYMTMAKEASESPIGCKGVITLDFFQGNRTPYKNPDAKGVFYGLTLNHTRADIYRSILEGISYGTRNIIETIESNDLDINNIMVCGGVTRNKFWTQMIADVTGKTITLTKNSSEGGILGCAIVSSIGSGRYKDYEEAVSHMVEKTMCYEPEKKAHEKYSVNYEKYLQLYESLKEMMSE